MKEDLNDTITDKTIFLINELVRNGVTILMDGNGDLDQETPHTYTNGRFEFEFDRGYITIVGVYPPEVDEQKETKGLQKHFKNTMKYIKTGDLILKSHINKRLYKSEW